MTDPYPTHFVYGLQCIAVLDPVPISSRTKQLVDYAGYFTLSKLDNDPEYNLERFRLNKGRAMRTERRSDPEEYAIFQYAFPQDHETAWKLRMQQKLQRKA